MGCETYIFLTYNTFLLHRLTNRLRNSIIWKIEKNYQNQHSTSVNSRKYIYFFKLPVFLRISLKFKKIIHILSNI